MPASPAPTGPSRRDHGTSLSCHPSLRTFDLRLDAILLRGAHAALMLGQTGPWMER
jgi:hypothetical protein